MINDKVTIWQDQVIIPTYPTGAPDKNPMFFENRVYQGSSGAVYPNPIIEKIENDKTDQSYKALYLENSYLKLMILPELGGRVQMAFDKVANRHFIYYNEVIKPALVGLCGPWLSGGIEFNWPQHHRPSTFEAVDYSFEEHADGSKTIWINELEKMSRTKGLAGFTLHPGKAYLEIKAKIYNRTNLPQTFLWWANPALSVNDSYQSIFPPDVHAVFDHGKRDVSAFPIAKGTYYKVDYSPGTDISRYRNIPVPTSYMAVNSNYDFVGGYEHDARAGMLHVSNHHLSPGKKQWTWGTGDFGQVWNKNLTDQNGPYIELMTGVFTDNQPDFTWLMPNEEKSFTQYFLPFRAVRQIKNATKDLIIGWSRLDDTLSIEVFSTSVQKNLTVLLYFLDSLLLKVQAEISPETPFCHQIDFQDSLEEDKLILSITDADNKEIIRYQPANDQSQKIPEPAKPAGQPAEIDTIEQLFLTGQHLEQYRHATFNPIGYYEEALRRDPKDLRSNNALGLWYLRRGKYLKSEAYFRQAISTCTERNPNPYDAEPYYNLGLTLRTLGRTEEAYTSFYKATWSSAWQDSAYFCLAQIDISRQQYALALEHINWSIDRNARNGKAYLVKTHALRKTGWATEAIEVATIALRRDPFNLSVLFELYYCHLDLTLISEAEELKNQVLELSRGEANTFIEYALEYAALGLYKEAIELLQMADGSSKPMVSYYTGYYFLKAADLSAAQRYFALAAAIAPDYCFPNKAEDIEVLEQAQKVNPKDARACYYLGNLWYDKRQYEDAIRCWEQSARLDPKFPTVMRNLGIAAFNKQGDPAKAVRLLETAYSLAPEDGRVLMELDQLYKRLNYAPENRLLQLEYKTEVADLRDDLFLEKISLYNFTCQFERAFNLVTRHTFHPWEGGEGKVSAQYVVSLVELAKVDLFLKNYDQAILKLEQAMVYPANLAEGKLSGVLENDIFYWLGCGYEGKGDTESAICYWNKATGGLSEPSAAIFYNDQQPDQIFYKGLALLKLGKATLGQEVFERLISYGLANQENDIKIDYFAVSLPDMLIFEEDLKKRNYIHCMYVAGLGFLGLSHLGLNKQDDARFYLQTVLENDVMHMGAKTHLGLVEMVKNLYI